MSYLEIDLKCYQQLFLLSLKIPIAHIHGGENSFGSLDESIRHSITKMSICHLFPPIHIKIGLFN